MKDKVNEWLRGGGSESGQLMSRSFSGGSARNWRDFRADPVLTERNSGIRGDKDVGRRVGTLEGGHWEGR